MMEIKQSFPEPMPSLAVGRTSKNSSDMLSSFRSAQIANALVSKTQSTKIYEFHSGDELLTYTSPSTDNYCSDRLITSDLYLIFEGKVRLLCQNIHLQRQVSADFLQAGAVFGADHLFCTTSLSYRAIATSPCRIIQIPHQQLIVQLQQLPQLHKYLSQIVRQREQLIFFKRFTQQRTIPNRILKHVLLPQLMEQSVSAGESLSRSLSTTAGYFWLRSGKILSPLNPSASPVIGAGWGYPDAVPEDWTAQTDLVIYKLPLDTWTTLDLLYC